MNSFAYITLLGYHSRGGSKDSRGGGGGGGGKCPPPPLKETLIEHMKAITTIHVHQCYITCTVGTKIRLEVSTYRYNKIP